MGKLDKVYNLVWYGDCDDPDCQPVDLSLYKDDLEFVFRDGNIGHQQQMQSISEILRI